MSRPVRVVSIFCGAGFADYALHRASEETGIPVEVVFACDSWEKAVAVYNANLPSRAVVADVKQLGREDLPAHDLVIGGPPCQPFSQAGKKRGSDDARDCIGDFMRLAGDTWLMENVRHLLVQAPWSERLCAADFGDVTLRRRWFYSSHLLHVQHARGTRRFGDIRSAPGTPGRRLFHGRVAPIADDDFVPGLTGNAYRNLGAPGKAAGLRSLTIDEVLAAHSVPASWDWNGASTDLRNRLCANGWPIGMGTAVLSAMLRAVAATMEQAAA